MPTAKTKKIFPKKSAVIMLGLYETKDGGLYVAGDTINDTIGNNRTWEKIVPEIVAAINAGKPCCNISKFAGVSIDGGKHEKD